MIPQRQIARGIILDILSKLSTEKLAGMLIRTLDCPVCHNRMWDSQDCGVCKEISPILYKP